MNEIVAQSNRYTESTKIVVNPLNEQAGSGQWLIHPTQKHPEIRQAPKTTSGDEGE
jgi:hypothetical protein